MNAGWVAETPMLKAATSSSVHTTARTWSTRLTNGDKGRSCLRTPNNRNCHENTADPVSVRLTVGTRRGAFELSQTTKL
ncbi:hypothetical protein I7I50_06316 [Histoplasma capsulatum G186AR]|uniref:Uncharacterized protein n=1 Tax=Ajellomyces capsulatus TaxID=5037 RepID=A0A8H7YZK4_AJECA|nr:hypothetical protein I7I52_10611 [Histoplasma capsulatum]QSS67290.1 hypothetical protein I7I50_06316 [Histoplasma capsulatum G186AR]